MTSTYPRVRSLPSQQQEDRTNTASGIPPPPITRYEFGTSNGKNGADGIVAQVKSSDKEGGGSGSKASGTAKRLINGQQSLAFFYSPLEHSTTSSWQQVPRGLADVVLGEPTPAVSGASHHRLAVKRTVVSVALSFCFGLATMMFKSPQSGLEFFAGYLVEQSLSVDNLFVFLMTFDYFQVPLEHQGRVLSWGIAGAILMRGVMIAFGVAVVQRFQWITILFAAILLVSSYKLLVEADSEEEDLSQNTLVRLSKKMVGAVDEYDGDRFFTKMGGKGKTVATPLFLCLVCIELSDFVFAVDSIPAVLGVSKDPFVVFSSNLFAIMALRSIYVIIAQAVNNLPYLKPAVALVLGFVGCKMLVEFGGVHIGTGTSLVVVTLIIGGGVVLSLCARTERRAPVVRHKRRHSGDGDLGEGGGGAEANVGGSDAFV